VKVRFGKPEKHLSLKGFGIDFPSNPKFKAKMDKGRNAINVEFYLVNTNTQWLKRNFEFIQAIYAGSEWLHLPFCQIRPPNIYHVLCPGRFQIYWAAIDVTVTFEGKLRKNVEASNFFMSKGIKSINKDMLWPEAWKMEINIRDLTPNNFNLYAEYYEHGFKGGEIARLENEIGLVEAIQDASKMMEQLTGEMKRYGNEVMKEGEAVATAMTSGMTQLINTMTNGKVDEEKKKKEEEKK
jgi:hypothetical protein